MDITRRDFVGAVGAAMLAPSSMADAGKPLLKLALFSDTHVIDAHGQAMLRRIFEFAKANGVDGVLAAGDLVGKGRISYLKLVADAWFSVFPHSRNSRGEKIEFISCYGNRELERKHTPVTKDGTEADAICRNPDAAWLNLFGEHIGERFCVRFVKGYPVILSHWGAQNDIGNVWTKLTEGLDLSKPFFYIQHPHLSGTVFNGMKADAAEATRLLSRYPAAITLSGHSHRSISDERAVWRGDFISIAGGAGGIVRPFTAGRLYENIGRLGARRNQPMPRVPHMPETAHIDGLCQVMLLSLYPDRVEIARHDCGIGEKAGPDWVLHGLGRVNRDHSFGAVSDVSAPQFPELSRVDVFERDGKNRAGETERQIVVSFPPAVPSDSVHNRVCDYEVAALMPDGTEIAKQYVLAENYFAPYRTVGRVECVFGRSSIANGLQPIWRVKPFGFFGLHGRPISSR